MKHRMLHQTIGKKRKGIGLGQVEVSINADSPTALISKQQ